VQLVTIDLASAECMHFQSSKALSIDAFLTVIVSKMKERLLRHAGEIFQFKKGSLSLSALRILLIFAVGRLVYLNKFTD
jgi:hypothetical protein